MTVETQTSSHRTPRWTEVLLWFGALIIMTAAAIYQRRTGPTYPLRGTIEVGSNSYRYALVRSQETSAPARVALPRPGEGATATLSWRRYPTRDTFAVVPMQVETSADGPELAAYLPVQPSAGKIEYFVEVTTANGMMRIPPANADDSLNILRYKDPVPEALLVSHVIAMFFTVLIGIRAGLGALFGRGNIRTLAWITLVGMTIGGLVLGPFVQKYAFGAYWTGFPWGLDLTDNKLLIMWLVWVAAAMTLGVGAKRIATPGRIAVAVAATCMLIVYSIPHSMRGSELDYGAVDSGTSAKEAIGTGRR